MTNETTQPNENKRRRTRAEMPIFAEFFGAVTALITAWLEVRVLPGPPDKPSALDLIDVSVQQSPPPHQVVTTMFAARSSRVLFPVANMRVRNRPPHPRTGALSTWPLRALRAA